jgi:hypothetical protein
MSFVVIVNKWMYGRPMDVYISKVISYKKKKYTASVFLNGAFHYKYEQTALRCANAFKGRMIIL